MRKILGALAAISIGLSVAQPTLWKREWFAFWEALAPNLLAEFIGLTLAVGIAEVFIRSYRARKGVDELAPLVVTQLGPAIRLDLNVLQKLGYTPKEFSAIHSDYFEGGLDPVHIPSSFKDRVLEAFQEIDLQLVQRAVDAVSEADEYVGRFAALLEPVHVLLMDRAQRNAQFLMAELVRSPRDKTDLAEAFLDYHDVLTNIDHVYGLEKAVKRLGQ
jgi:hypothetical protein